MLDAEYEGWAHIKEGNCYCMEDKWDSDLFYCRYIIYDRKENTVKVYSDISKTKYSMFIRDQLNYSNEDCVFSSNPNAYSHDLIKIISLEDFRCDVNEANLLKICKRIHDTPVSFNVDDLDP